MLKFIILTVEVRTALLEQEAAALLQHFALGQFSESCYLSGMINFSMLTTCVHTHTKKKEKGNGKKKKNQKMLNALHSPSHQPY